MNCWKQKEYIGLGVAAHSYLNDTRFSNTNNIENYIDNVENKDIEEVQSLEDKQDEFMLFGMRMLDGVDIAVFKQKFGKNPIYLYKDKLNELVEEGLVVVDLNHIRLTNKGLDLANLVFEEFV